MSLPPLPPLPKQVGHIHSNGEYCADSKIDARLNSTGWPVDLLTADQLRTYAEQYGRLCADAEREVIVRFIDNEYVRQWRDAYAAFVGAFDTPQQRRLMNDEYSNDARLRLREFNESFYAAIAKGDQR